jgi:hypothetical protein
MRAPFGAINCAAMISQEFGTLPILVRSLIGRSDMAKYSSHGIIKDGQAQEQPADKERARVAQRSDPKKSPTHEATRDPRLNDAEKTPGSGMTPDGSGDAPTG